MYYSIYFCSLFQTRILQILFTAAETPFTGDEVQLKHYLSFWGQNIQQPPPDNADIKAEALTETI